MASQPAAAVQLRQSGESLPAIHWEKHLSRPHWTTAPQQSAHPVVIPRSSFMQVAVQGAAPTQRRPHSATLVCMSMRLLAQSVAFTQAPAARPQLPAGELASAGGGVVGGGVVGGGVVGGGVVGGGVVGGGAARASGAVVPG
jgi:hypothetical protein